MRRIPELGAHHRPGASPATLGRAEVPLLDSSPSGAS